MSSWGLTRYVIFTPRFYLSNQCPYTVYAIELDRPDDEIEVPSGICVPFWPKSPTPHMKVAVKILKRRNETQPFRYDIVEHTLLQLSNEVSYPNNHNVMYLNLQFVCNLCTIMLCFMCQ